MKFYLSAFLIVLFIIPLGLFAGESFLKREILIAQNDDFSIEDTFEDFDTDIKTEEKNGDKKEEKKDAPKKSFMRFGGYLKLHTSYNFAQDDTSEHEGLSALQGEIMVEAEAKFAGNWKFYINGSSFYNSAYSINGRDDYQDDFLDEYEDDAELKEAYISGSLTTFMDIRAGRQIVVWGKSDYIRVTDVLNPLNLKEPGLTDIKDLRLPVAMTRTGFFFGDFALYAIAIHEHRYNKMPAYGSDFYMLPYNLPDEEFPEDTFRNNEYAFSFGGHFTGWDAAVYYYNGFDDSFHLEDSIKKHARVKMYGATFNIALGNFLLKAETAFFEGLRYSGVTTEYKRSDVFLGFEYSGFTNTTIGVEAVNRNITDYDDTLEASGQDENLFQSVFFIKRDFLNETLSLTLMASTFGDGSDGAYQRVTCEYDINDYFKIYGGVIFYKSGDYMMLKDVDDNDRVFVDLTYTF